MSRRSRRWNWPSLTAAWLAVVAAPVAIAGPAPTRVVFNRDVLPILSDTCFRCHGPDAKARKADLRLDVKESALRTEEPVIVPGQSGASELVRRITSADRRRRMPPAAAQQQLTRDQIAILTRWVDEGAAWGKHWAYEPPVRPPLPAVSERSWPQNPIDVFILARLERERLRPSPAAKRTALIRRVTLDLLGVPPTPAEVDAFGADRGPDAYERLVDRLLASPRYGERMAWDWLDAARYADTNGYQGDPERTMWPWRDWVVSALNANMPYDRFTLEQLAGDLLPQATLEQKIATGFNRNHMHNGEGGRIPEETRVENVMDRAETTATVWLGSTIGCARCHDHKFDPFTQKEYYQLFAFFNNTSEDGQGIWNGKVPPLVEFTTPSAKATLGALAERVRAGGTAVAALEQQLFPRPKGKDANESAQAASLPGKVREALKRRPGDRNSGALQALINHFQKHEPAYARQLTALKQAVEARDRLQASWPRVMIMDELAKPRETFVLVRGAYNKPADKVSAGVPASLPPLPAGAARNRLALARWLVEPNHPLTARVTVNRSWQLFFGTGLVKTAEDFGIQGAPPSHPELLDWLATELVRSGWDSKRLHRLIVTSATYRQGSRVSAALLERDPENRLLARGPRYRLPAWMIRDQALAAAGLLVGKLGGPPVKPYQPPGVWEEATFGFKSYQPDKGEGLYRRSLYTFWRRIVGPTIFFDSATRQTCTVRVARTNSPLHALATLNDTTYVEAARVLAERVLQAQGSDPAACVRQAFRQITARPPTAAEVETLLDCRRQLRAVYAQDRAAAPALLHVGAAPRDERLDPGEHAALTGLCLLIFNLDETLTKQ